MITSSRFIKPTKSIFTTWQIALSCLTVEEIDEATVFYLQNYTDDFPISTGKFIEIARNLTKEKKRDARLLKEAEEETKYLPNHEGQAKIKENIQKILGGLKNAERD